MIFSIVIPVYRNEQSLERLLVELGRTGAQLSGELEVVFVVDGSPDDSFATLQRLLPTVPFKSQLLLLSRNFGSFSAIAAGLRAARGDYFSVISADLQEPPELTVKFFETLAEGDCDLVLGKRESRQDPFLNRLASQIFWYLYRRFVQREMPKGGVDVFACNRAVHAELLRLEESNSTLVGLLMWIGFRRKTVSYHRVRREHGQSAWSFRRKLRYLKDSVFAFSDLPVRLLGMIGLTGLIVAVCLGCAVLAAKLTGNISVPGYAASTITVIFFGALNSLGIAILGEYLWRAFENTKQRPRHIIVWRKEFDPDTRGSDRLDPVNGR